VISIENLKISSLRTKEMILDAAEAVLGFFGFDRTAYSGLKKNTRRKIV
jgi:AcrR family transcriptional regulator